MNIQKGYEDLANAIIVSAVKDYRAAKRVLKRHPNNDVAIKTVDEIERFFHSVWYSQLTKVDGVRLLKSLQQEG